MQISGMWAVVCVGTCVCDPFVCVCVLVRTFWLVLTTLMCVCVCVSGRHASSSRWKNICSQLPCWTAPLLFKSHTHSQPSLVLRLSSGTQHIIFLSIQKIISLPDALFFPPPDVDNTQLPARVCTLLTLAPAQRRKPASFSSPHTAAVMDLGFSGRASYIFHCGAELLLLALADRFSTVTDPKSSLTPAFSPAYVQISLKTHANPFDFKPEPEK